MKNLNSNDRPEFIGQIVDIFEDYLDEKKIDIPSKDRDAEINSLLTSGTYATTQEAIDNEGLARIYGEDYDEIGGEIEHGLDSNTDAETIIDNVYGAFLRIVSKNPGASVPATDKTLLEEKVRETFRNWKLIN